MRFLVDECTGPAVGEWLRKQKHEVFSVFKEARGLDDDQNHSERLADSFVVVTDTQVRFANKQA
jgi:hypothetical protein